MSTDAPKATCTRPKCLRRRAPARLAAGRDEPTLERAGLYALRTGIEERHRQVKCFWDLTRFHSTARSLVVNQTVLVSLSYSMLQLHLLKEGHAALNRRTSETARRLLPDGDRVIICRQQYFGFFTLLEYTEMALKLEGKARRRALAKARRLQQEAPPA